MTEPTPRPRQVTLVGWLTMVGSVAVVALVFDRLAGLNSLETRQAVEKFLAEPPGSDLGVGVDGVLSVIRTLSMVAAGCATAAAILGYQVLRRSRSARLALTVLAVPLFVAGMVTGGFVSSLVAASANRCLDVYDNRTAPGTKIELWDCNGGANQAWTPTQAGELRVYGGSQCLDAYDDQTAPGTVVELWDCNGGANQRFDLRPDGTIVGVQSGLCLDVAHGDQPPGNANGAQIQLWTCNGGANQQWRLG